MSEREERPARRKARECLWLCGRPADTDEDIVSTWLKPTVGAKSSPKNRFGVRNIPSISGLEVEYEVPHKDVDALALRASKMVCAECNNGWMSDLEGRVKTAGLLSMVKGASVRVTPSLVAHIGTWAAMKSILVCYADRPGHPVQTVPDDVRRQFGRDHAPPPNVLVLAVKIEPFEMAIAVFTGRVQTTLGRIPLVYFSAFSLRSVSFLTIIGTLARSQRDALGSPNRVVRLWPRRELAPLDWPPSGNPFAIKDFHHFNETALGS